MTQRQKLWSDEELKAATDAYLYMLQLEISRIPFSISDQSDLLLSGPLHLRSEASVRYRMRNISFVVEQMGLPILEAYSPAPQVGRNVKKKITSYINDRRNIVEGIKHNSVSVAPLRSTSEQEEILDGLNNIKSRVENLRETKSMGMGHNNPPSDMSIMREEMSSVIHAIDELEAKITKAETDPTAINALAKTIANFGLKVFVWSGQRLTDFSKSAAIAAGGGFGLWLSGLGESIAVTLREALRLLLF